MALACGFNAVPLPVLHTLALIWAECDPCRMLFLDYALCFTRTSLVSMQVQNLHKTAKDAKRGSRPENFSRAGEQHMAKLGIK